MLAFVLALLCATPVFAQDAPTDSPQKENTEQAAAEEAKPFAEEIGLLEEAFPDDGKLVGALTKTLKKEKSTVPIKHNAIVFGILMVMLGFIFWSSSSEFKPFKLFYKVVPMLLVCYFLPSLLTFFHLIDHTDDTLYQVATRYLLPATLVFLTLSIDLKEIFRLGPKALIMFLTGTFGVVIGGPIAVLIVSWIRPDIIGVDGVDAVWRGLSTVAGSWIGGGANQAAMQGVFMNPENATPEIETSLNKLFSVMIAVDVIVAEVWMMFLLLGVGKADAIDRLFKADSSSIKRLQDKMETFS